MSIQLNHTIVRARDKHASAAFLAGILGLEVSPDFGRFAPVAVANGVTLDYMTAADPQPQHYAFLLDDEEFDAAFARIKEQGLDYYAEPGGDRHGQINTRWGGRGVYFDDPDGHAMEILTRAP
ncbi:catechol 2,3-dioxygenase-like lactoylglutathione lyase family enzyme [Catenulispora sp. MAP5-51]|uniref:VOC family protein n=1 Tax=Catenulispora sp. MAP5-51 TaxID=3156298 RepID=UPI0035165598